MAEETKKDESTEAEEALIKQSQETMHEMSSAMATMMEASTKMMQSFLDVRLSYLKVMRAGLDDPKATFEMMSKNMTDLSEAVKKSGR